MIPGYFSPKCDKYKYMGECTKIIHTIELMGVKRFHLFTKLY